MLKIKHLTFQKFTSQHILGQCLQTAKVWDPVLLAHDTMEGRHTLGPGGYNKIAGVLIVVSWGMGIVAFLQNNTIGVVTKQPNLCFLICVYFKNQRDKNLC